MAIPPRINRHTSRDLAVIAVRVLDDAHMTWIAAEVESEHALRAWFHAGAPQAADAYLAYRAAVDREEAAARDLQRLSELTQPYQERLTRSQ
jgi:alpha-D-ribose 1-methylphosphonate 5-triphosphate synthase subunit PhnH